MLDSASDPLSSVVTLLKPAVSISKIVTAGGQWLVERHDMASPFYCAMVEGQCRLHVTGRDPVILRAGDFVLIPHLQGFTMSSEVPPPPHVPRLPLETGPGQFRLGTAEAPVDMRALVGHCRFDTPARGLLVSLLPEMIHVSGQNRLTALVPVIHEAVKAGTPVRCLALSQALWARMCEGTREDGTVIAANDPVWDDLQTAAKAARTHPRAWLDQPRIFGDLAEVPAFAEAFESWLAMIWDEGAESALRAYLAEGPIPN